MQLIDLPGRRCNIIGLGQGFSPFNELFLFTGKLINFALMIGIVSILQIIKVILGLFVAVPCPISLLLRNAPYLLPLSCKSIKLLINFIPVFSFMIDRFI